MKPIAAGLLFVLAVGCAPHPEQVIGREYVEKRALAAANSKRCMDAVKSDSQTYERLNELFIYDLQDNRQLTKIANRNYVTDQNVQDLIRFREIIQSCYDQTLLDYGHADNRYADYILNVRASSDDNLLALLNREITIGERNVYLLETLLNNRSKFAEIDREVLSDLSKEHYLKSHNIKDGSAFPEEKIDAPTVSLPRQLPRSAPARSSDISSDFPAVKARCRFEGNAIRCD